MAYSSRLDQRVNGYGLDISGDTTDVLQDFLSMPIDSRAERSMASNVWVEKNARQGY
jgi:hypothetical protein